MLSRNETYGRLAQIALGDFGDIVEDVKTVEGKLRLLLIDGSYIDIWLSVKKEGVYAYHWERREIDGTIYRYNNLPDKQAKKLKTFPRHFHKKTEKNILESDLSDKPEEALHTLLEFARGIIQ